MQIDNPVIYPKDARMRIVFLLVLLPLLSVCQGAEARKPNIIYLMMDDAGFGDLSCYGQQHFTTPHIDRVAAEGMKFLNHYSGSTVCAPTRCVFMTGLHTGHSYVRGNREIQPEGQAPLPADIVTIPRLLKKGGYTTGVFGKWGLGAPGSASDPMEHFDRFYGYNCQRQAHTYYPNHLWSDREKVELDGKTYSHDLITEQIHRFIRDNRDEPFFAFLAVAIPHAAMHVPEEYVAPFRKKFPQFEDKIGKYRGPEVRNPIAAFAGMMTKMDEDVGDLVALLEELEIDDNTIILITSDNGPHREGGHDPDFFDSNGPLTGYKRDLTEGGIRTFLIARWPGQIEAGSINGHISAHWDMLPTFCDLAGVETPAGLDGISMVPTLTGEGEQEKHDYLYWEFYERGGKKAARWGDWKAVQLGLNKQDNPPIAIYDLSSDLGEETDLSSARPELVKRAQEIFKEAHTPSPNWTWRK